MSRPAPLRRAAKTSWPWLRPFAWSALVAIAYLGGRLAFAHSLGSAGLFSPSGLGDPIVLLLGATTIVLRLALLLLAPGIVAYALTARALSRLCAGSGNDEDDEPRPPP
ncbi:MAG: hypothetical protein JRI23_02065 [Deltaproteobacteria bacterium]|jgi:hypothetical protein|nr:hypothetical protein [Deltaproteobacteria bacterium]MBW2530264.1 hypothetical protein [Deltaproteobacteria bacterium]